MHITIKLMLILALVSTPAVAANLFVPTQFGTIQQAVDAASPGDRILVAEGSFAGAQVDKWVKISGVGEDTVINDGPRVFGLFHDGFRLITGADKTEISDLKIELSGPPNLLRFGIFGGRTADRVTVRNVTFVELDRAIDIIEASGWIITDNIIEGIRETPESTFLSFGIRLRRTGNCLVAHNTIDHVSSGGSPGQVYSGIVLAGSISLGLSENNKVIGNTISVNATGALSSNDIELFDPPSSCVGLTPAGVIGNKIINNDAENVLLTPSCLIDFNVIQ